MNDQASPSEGSTAPLILVVDDDESAARLAETYLRKAGFQVQIAWEGESALEATAAAKPDAVLLDLYLPGLDGFEICRRLKDEEATRNVPVIILSSHHDHDQVMEALKAGADDFLVKPLDPHVLLQKIYTNILGKEEDVEREKADGEERSREKRQYFRIAEIAQAVLHLPVESLDLSEGGAGLLSQSPVKAGTVLTLTCQQFGEVLGSSEVAVRVRYVLNLHGKRRYRIGVEFIGLSEKERKKIRQYVYRRQISRVKTRQADSF